MPFLPEAREQDGDDIVAEPQAEQQLVMVVTGGVDTHADTHVAAAVDPVGRRLGHAGFPTTPPGYAALLAWLQTFGPVSLVGVEGTGAYAAGLARFLTAAQVAVVEVDRPDRKARRYQGKSAPLDVYAAAAAALSGRASGTPKTRTGTVEMIRTLRVERTSAVKARAAALTQLKATINTAPDTLREQLRGLDGAALLHTCSALRPARGPRPVMPPQAKRLPRPGLLLDAAAAAKRALAALARRIAVLNDEIAASTTTCTRSSNRPHRRCWACSASAMTSPASCWSPPETTPTASAPKPPSPTCAAPRRSPPARAEPNATGSTAAATATPNHALWRIGMTRLRFDPRTRAYRDRRAAQQLSNKDILRCLKRYIARQVHRAILTDLTPNTP